MNGGTVIFAGSPSNVVVIDHRNEDFMRYRHLDSLAVEAGDTVVQDQNITRSRLDDSCHRLRVTHRR